MHNPYNTTITTTTMQKIIPANGGVLLEVSDPSIELTDGGTLVEATGKPLVGYVVRVGNGVPWLKPRQAVIYDPSKAQRFGPFEALVDQRAILGVIDGVTRAGCLNGCHEQPGALCGQCPSDKEDREYGRS
jgi:hypothetical protein